MVFMCDNFCHDGWEIMMTMIEEQCHISMHLFGGTSTEMMTQVFELCFEG